VGAEQIPDGEEEAIKKIADLELQILQKTNGHCVKKTNFVSSSCCTKDEGRPFGAAL